MLSTLMSYDGGYHRIAFCCPAGETAAMADILEPLLYVGVWGSGASELI